MYSSYYLYQNYILASSYLLTIFAPLWMLALLCLTAFLCFQELSLHLLPDLDISQVFNSKVLSIFNISSLKISRAYIWSVSHTYSDFRVAEGVGSMLSRFD